VGPTKRGFSPPKRRNGSVDIKRTQRIDAKGLDSSFDLLLSVDVGLQHDDILK
jgi:hypothetical protein